ncbi:catalase [Aureimonas sp. Leaf454]|uniref:catalase family protein n=1 Tax=Aureimonas sp. Leaf454 TaxID=1736381 RepID=UPI0006FC7F0B|nr:catalase family protein [Aureimonas sp. Leaf454]KQT42994.1 catalase [Aureimonas sp. Leaf454]
MTLTEWPTGLAEPVRFTSDMEIIRDDEFETIAELVSTLRRVMETAEADEGRARRAVHARCQGLVRGELAVIENLHPRLLQGLFAEPRVYPVLLRFSTNPGDRFDLGASVPRGVALKVLGVDGERLPGADPSPTQDFVMADSPAFSASDARTFLKSLKLLTATTDEPQVLKKAASAALRGVEALIEAIGGSSATLALLDSRRAAHVLASTFFSQAPLLFGPYVAKLQLAPVGPELASLRHEAIEHRGRPDALREAVADFFESQSATFELRAQLLTDRATMPVEDASVIWPEARSPHLPLARITVPPQPVWDAARAEGADESLSFSPWQGLAAHRPLGSIMRARRPAYDMSASFRASRNGCPIHNPRSEADLPF